MARRDKTPLLALFVFSLTSVVLGAHGVLPDVFAIIQTLRCFLVAIVHTEDHGPVRPRVAGSAALRWCRQQLQVDDLSVAATIPPQDQKPTNPGLANPGIKS
eukprot:2640186-Amphidinium_carterae.1